MTKDYYTILGVSPEASQEEINLAYRKITSNFHQDKSPEFFDEVEEAYSILSDPQVRSQYDSIYKIPGSLARNFDGLDISRLATFGRGELSSDSEDSQLDSESSVFEDLISVFQAALSNVANISKEVLLFGGKNNFKSIQDILLDLPVSPVEARLGGYKPISYLCQIGCSDCYGSGSKNGEEMVPCVVCGNKARNKGQGDQGSNVWRSNIGTEKEGAGNKVINFNSDIANLKLTQPWQSDNQETVTGRDGLQQKNNIGAGKICLVCAGLGSYPEKNCPKCRGEGRVLANRIVEIKIPKGVKDDTLLKISGEGHRGFRGSKNGDLLVKIIINSDKNI